MHIRKANVGLIHPQRNKPGEGNIFSFHFCPLKGGCLSDLFFIYQTISHQVPFMFLLDILEYFQVDGSITSMPLVKVLSHPVCIFIYHLSFPHNTSFLLSEDSKISSSLSLPSKKLCLLAGWFAESLAVMLQGLACACASAVSFFPEGVLAAFIVATSTYVHEGRARLPLYFT